MRNVSGIVILVISIALALGCSREPIKSTAAPAATQAAAARCPSPALQIAQPGESSEIAELAPVAGEQCGGVVCRPGLRCCNPSCNHCTPKGVECSQESCN
jgi:hypothetical protein